MKFLKTSIVIFLILTILVSCSEPETTPVLSAIHNYSSYKAIGAGVSSNDTSSRSVGNSEGKLLGQKEDGTIEVITFDDENGVEKNQTYYLTCFTATENFCFLGYSKYSSENIETRRLDSNSMNYILDKRSGKMFYIENSNVSLNIGHEYDGKVICGAEINEIKGIYFYSVENDMLKIELIVDNDTIPFYDSIFHGDNVDRYGNHIVLGLDYLISKDGKIKRLNNQFHLNINKIFYDISNPNSVAMIDSNGNCVNAEYVPTIFIEDKDGFINNLHSIKNPTKCILNTNIKSDTFYFWDRNFSQNGGEYYSLSKVTWQDNEHTKYDFTEVQSFYDYKSIMPSFYFDSVGKVLYISDDLSVITFYDVLKNEYNDVLSFNNVIRVKEITIDKYDNVVVTYVDNDLNTINLYIDTDGNYSTSFTPPEYIIKYLSPIN